MDSLAGAYGWDDEAIIWRKPLARLLAYFAAICLRNGNDPAAPTYEEEEVMDHLEAGGGGVGREVRWG